MGLTVMRLQACMKITPSICSAISHRSLVLSITPWWLRMFSTVRRQRSLDRTGGLNKGEFLAHRNVHRSEDETANPTIEGTG